MKRTYQHIHRKHVTLITTRLSHYTLTYSLIDMTDRPLYQQQMYSNQECMILDNQIIIQAKKHINKHVQLINGESTIHRLNYQSIILNYHIMCKQRIDQHSL